MPYIYAQDRCNLKPVEPYGRDVEDDQRREGVRSHQRLLLIIIIVITTTTTTTTALTLTLTLTACPALLLGGLNHLAGCLRRGLRDAPNSTTAGSEPRDLALDRGDSELAEFELIDSPPPRSVDRLYFLQRCPLWSLPARLAFAVDWSAHTPFGTISSSSWP